VPRLKYVKLTGWALLICPHREDWLVGEVDAFGDRRCTHCGHRVNVVLTPASLARALDAMASEPFGGCR
jgi:hypothetical protein